MPLKLIIVNIFSYFFCAGHQQIHQRIVTIVFDTYMYIYFASYTHQKKKFKMKFKKKQDLFC